MPDTQNREELLAKIQKLKEANDEYQKKMNEINKNLEELEKEINQSSK